MREISEDINGMRGNLAVSAMKTDATDLRDRHVGPDEKLKVPGEYDRGKFLENVGDTGEVNYAGFRVGTHIVLDARSSVVGNLAPNELPLTPMQDEQGTEQIRELFVCGTGGIQRHFDI